MSLPFVALDARLVGRESTGDSTYWGGLLEGLAQVEPGIEFLLFSNGPRPPGIPESEKFRWIELKARTSRWWSLVRFPLAARKAGARAIHTQYNLSPLCGSRGITTIHDVSFFIGPEWFRRKDLALLRRFVPASARRAAKVVTVSETSRSEIERFIPAAKGKIVVALNGPNPRIAPMERAEAGELVRRTVGVAEPYFLTVGTRWPRKNMALAVRACELLPSEMPHRLLITGKPGWGEERLGGRALAAGYVDEPTLSALYSAADLYLAPSRHEGFGIPLLEAFVCGCPVVCSSGGALPEVAGDAALVLPDWEPESWARAISALAMDSSKLDAMRERGYARAKEFSWRRSADAHTQAYLEVAGRD
jgi:glycosyltransferase involved in cell wall biosynthesis